MKLASVLSPLSDTNLRLAAQCGVEGVVHRYPGPKLRDLLAIKKRLKPGDFGSWESKGFFRWRKSRLGRIAAVWNWSC